MLCSGISHWWGSAEVLKVGGTGAECQQDNRNPCRKPHLKQVYLTLRTVPFPSPFCVTITSAIISHSSPLEGSGAPLQPSAFPGRACRPPASLPAVPRPRLQHSGFLRWHCSFYWNTLVSHTGLDNITQPPHIPHIHTRPRAAQTTYTFLPLEDLPETWLHRNKSFSQSRISR